ncbi:hypothetical protein FRC15_006120 [Serendipita sp. 397]|nr:hypothetical protein FRC15_006120 [Serendipita sp. 397]KAG8833898.1 hypothetical protein FRC18_002915 [Serendipita sp. 400]
MSLALKPQNNRFRSSHTVSPTEKTPNVWGDILPTSLSSRISNRGRKRRRESSSDEDDFGENIEPTKDSLRRIDPQRPRHQHTRSLQPIIKRPRRDARELPTIENVVNVGNGKPDLFSDEDDEHADGQPPEFFARTTPPTSRMSPSQYTQANDLLRSLHLHRSRPFLSPHPSQHDTPSPSPSQNKETRSAKPLIREENLDKTTRQETHIGDDEKDHVTRLYEEANKALGLLSLQRRQQTGRSQPAYSDSEESSELTEEE